MKIKSLKASIHRIPLVVPLIEEGALKRDMVFCEVETDDGIIGWGVTGNYLAAAVVAAL
ncbi:MAG: mandelate racemase/muconate lactonizing enzyme family protein, partial [Proteobacteria bacterium]|nr:mandelate racemase/muconate lactonizing enzyme family protein [Pseudomonadota bacterium]